ncbi:hypothetical protein ACIBJE_03140 [Micromonospora sp. NPDC050187]
METITGDVTAIIALVNLTTSLINIADAFKSRRRLPRDNKESRQHR